MSEIWFTSDTHFMHKNILKFCPNTRVGKDAREMTERLIYNWNNQVADGDDVYLLGDVFFCGYEQALDIMQRLNGNIHLVWGNHDQVIMKNKKLKDCFASTSHYRKLRLDGKTVILHHYPYLEWEHCHHGAYALFGHVHGGLDRSPHVCKYRTMDVGIDSRPEGIHQPRDGAMTLWNWDQVQHILRDREILSHH